MGDDRSVARCPGRHAQPPRASDHRALGPPGSCRGTGRPPRGRRPVLAAPVPNASELHERKERGHSRGRDCEREDEARGECTSGPADGPLGSCEDEYERADDEQNLKDGRQRVGELDRFALACTWPAGGPGGTRDDPQRRRWPRCRGKAGQRRSTPRPRRRSPTGCRRSRRRAECALLDDCASRPAPWGARGHGMQLHRREERGRS